MGEFSVRSKLFHIIALRASFTSSLLPIDEKPSLYPADAPGPANSAGAPPSYGSEGDPAATRVVYVQALPKVKRSHSLSASCVVPS